MKTLGALVDRAGVQAAILSTAFPPGVQEKVETITGWVTSIITALAVIGLLIIGGTMFFQNRRGEGSETGGRLGWWAAGCVLIGAAAQIANALIA